MAPSIEYLLYELKNHVIEEEIIDEECYNIPVNSIGPIPQFDDDCEHFWYIEYQRDNGITDLFTFDISQNSAIKIGTINVNTLEKKINYS